ncbi:MAG: type I methionyl aminopeptidase [Patescibacteria group bacterium]|nr:type I methionyl aminopeptidase [Patescibacteria group bacterium]MCL5432484.1 type I methionyl aminopeptidase [Patescibacteria group bacterium]
MIQIKTPKEIEIMREGGKILARILSQTLEKAVPGVTTWDLDKFADAQIAATGAKPSFKMEKGYYFATCMCVNDMVVHGLPDDRPLEEGDILGIDMGVYYKGFHTDASWTKEIQNSKGKSQKSKFLNTGEEALKKAIAQCRPGNHIGDISQTIQEIVEGGGYSCVKQLVGHGVGKSLHEDPEIPCYLRGQIKNTSEIKAGMVLAIEIIYNQGKSNVIYSNDDGWTIVTRDGAPSGLFEHTVAVTPSGPQILTCT